MNNDIRKRLNNGEALEGVLEEVKAGSRSAAYLLLSEISRRLTDEPETIPKTVREWLSESLQSIAYGEPAIKILGLTGKSLFSDKENPIHFTIEAVYDHIVEKGLPLHKSDTSPSAFQDAADKFHISPSTAEKYYYFAEKNYITYYDNFYREIVGLTEQEIEDKNQT